MVTDSAADAQLVAVASDPTLPQYDKVNLSGQFLLEPKGWI